MMYTKKQAELLSRLKEGSLKRINILHGSVRSGKTYISLVLWAFWILTMPKDKMYLMAAKTLTALKRNCLDLLTELVGKEHFTYSLTTKEGFLFGRRIILEGASDLRSEGKIRGLSLSGAYCDEVTLFPEDFFTMLLSRLSDPGAKLFATTNPDNPAHFIKRNYIDREKELDLAVFPFTVDDNTFLPPDYVESLKKEYTGVFYRRYIEGLWVAAEGAVYREFADDPAPFITENVPAISFASVGVDFGGSRSATAFVLNGFTPDFKTVVTLDEFYTKRVLSPGELEECFIAFLERNLSKYRIYDAWCDSAESTLIRGLESAVLARKLPVNVRPAMKKPILDRIRFFHYLMSHGKYLILPHCEHVKEALSSAVWDSTASGDVRLDDGTVNVDSLDALEYAAENYMNDFLDLR